MNKSIVQPFSRPKDKTPKPQSENPKPKAEQVFRQRLCQRAAVKELLPEGEVDPIPAASAALRSRVFRVWGPKLSTLPKL